MRSSPVTIRHIVMKYVIVAELTFLDALESVFASGKGEFWRRVPKTSHLGREVREFRGDFEALKSSISPALRDTVRNRGAAHKDRLFVETEAELMQTLSSKEPGRLFQMGRGVLDMLASKPIWTWGYSRTVNRIGGILGTCSRPTQREPTVVEFGDGFGMRGFHGLHPDSAVEEREFDDLTGANCWADSLDLASLVDGEPSNKALNPTCGRGRPHAG